MPMEACMEITNISEAKANLSRLIERVMNGEEIIIGKAGKPVAMLVPYHLDPTPRRLGAGSWKGKIWIADDFDETDDEIIDFFYGETEDGEPAT
jgi:prevent-host-death family protein